ncbi:MAG: hypothetical protein ACRERZ_00710 [Gammaproteobacteria bacterium]
MTDRTTPFRQREWRAPPIRAIPPEPPVHFDWRKYLLYASVSGLIAAGSWIWALSATVATLQATVHDNAELSLQRAQDMRASIQQDSQLQTEAIAQLNSNMQAGFMQINQRLNTIQNKQDH